MRWPRFRRKRDQLRHVSSALPEFPGLNDHVRRDAGVVLGFADGTESELDGQDPHALALKAVADVLMHQDAV